MNNSSKKDESHGIGIGVGLAAIAAAAAGAYYLYGSDKAVKNRRQVKSWMLRMKAEVMDEVENIKDLTQDSYEKAVDTVSKKYASIKSIDVEELTDLAKRMKDHWKDIQEDVSKTTSKEIKKIRS